MADVTVTATSVVPDSGSEVRAGTLGGTVTAGQTVYLDSATNTFKLADSNASAATATVVGIAMNGGSSGQLVQVCVGGTLNPGFTVGVGSIYVQSGTAGGIAPAADLVTGWRTTVLGVGITSSQLRLLLYNSGVAVP